MATNKRLIKSNDEGGLGLSFNTVTYTGNGGTNAITDVGFQPDFVWIKSRSHPSWHSLQDSVRGATKTLFSNETNVEVTYTNAQTSFDANGFTLGSDNEGGSVNLSGRDYVAWCWKAAGYANTFNVLENGSTTSSATAAGAGITAGSLTTGWSVSANRDAGFSIVGWQSSGSTATVGHGLGVAPNIIIAKKLDSTGNWNVYSSEVGNNKRLFLNDTIAATVNDVWGDTDPTNSVFTQGVTSTTENVIAYCFAEVAGFSKFGSYDGTGSAGNFVSTSVDGDAGFEPAFVMMKAYNDTSDWFIVDNKRNITDPRNSNLRPNNANTEADAASGLNFLTNGFELTGAAFNDSGVSWIFMAFANQF